MPGSEKGFKKIWGGVVRFFSAYLAAHSPTVRAETQTYQVAYRLYRGERLFEES